MTRLPFFDLEIITPKGQVFKGRCESLVVRGLDGFIGVMANHAPMIAVLAPGPLSIRNDREETVFQAGEGFLQVADNAAIVLLESVEEEE